MIKQHGNKFLDRRSSAKTKKFFYFKASAQNLHSVLWYWHRCRQSRTSPSPLCSYQEQAHQHQVLLATVRTDFKDQT